MPRVEAMVSDHGKTFLRKRALFLAYVIEILEEEYEHGVFHVLERDLLTSS